MELTEYLFTAKFGINVVNFHFIKAKYYNKNKHGIIQHKESIDYNLTRREVNWYGRNYANMWCFVH